MVKHVIIISVLLSCSIKEAASQNLDSLKSELEQIYLTNLKIRITISRHLTKGDFDSPKLDSLKTEMLTFDSLSLFRVTEIINLYGWLGISEIGEQANQAIYMTIQHADIEDQVLYFPLLSESAQNGESHLADMATMEDRLLVRQGKKQKYGTQSEYIDGKATLFPIEDKKNANKLRRSVGLKRMKKN